MTAAPTTPIEVAKLGDIAAEAGLHRVSMLAWRDLDDPEAGGSELHASNIAKLWAEAGIEVNIRTSYAAGHPQVSWRDGYRVDPQGRSLPRVPARRVQRDDGLARRPRRAGGDLERHAVLLAAVVAHRARHLAAPRARGDVADDAAAAARGVRQLRRVEGGAADLPPHVDGHAVGVEQARDGPRPRLQRRSGERRRARASTRTTCPGARSRRPRSSSPSVAWCR